jgi:hypothetical protein
MALDTNLVSDWTFNAASGNESDGVGSNTLTASGSPGSAAGLLGNARQFTAASSQYFSAPSGFIDAYGAWSFEIWFKPTATALGSNWPRVIDFGTGTGKYLFFTVRSGVLGARPSVGLKVGGTEYQSGLPTALVADVWHQLVVTAKTLCYIGKAQFADPYCDGLMDQGRLWSRELTPEDVAALYNGGTPIARASLAGTAVGSAPSPNANGRLEYQLFSFNESGETLSLFESADGIRWTNYAVTYAPATGTVRDPSGALVGSQWWIVHTRTAAAATTFGVAKADDATLTAWTEVGSVDCSSVVSTGHVWAPEFARNADGTVYLDSGDGYPRVIVSLQATSGGNNALYEVHPTNAAWTTWSTPAALTGSALPANVIDGFPIDMGGGTWKMWVKDEGTGQIQLLTSTALTTGWDTSTTDPGSWGTGHEGVSAFKIGSTWLIYADRFGSANGIGYALSDDDFATVGGMSGLAADVLPRHGTVVYAPEIGAGNRRRRFFMGVAA